MKSRLYWTMYTETWLAIWQKKWCMSKASFRSNRPEVLPQEGAPERRSKPTGEHPCGSVIPTELLCDSIEVITSTGMLPRQSPSSPQNTPSQEHLHRAASVFSYLKLIIQINQQKSYARNFYKFYMDSFQVSIF